MRKTVLIVLVVAFKGMIHDLSAQSITPEIISSGGDYNKSTSGSISWTIGEPVNETLNGSSGMLTTGFHQPVLYLITATENITDKAEVIAFPNPVMNELLIDFTGMKTGSYSLSLADSKGLVIYQEETSVSRDNKQYRLSMQGRTSGTYLLTITNHNDFIKTVKIEKPE